MAITLDLTDLPLESTGIVCGVASRLSDGMRGRSFGEVFNMSYLSTARAGHVIVYAEELEDVMEAFRGGQMNGSAEDHSVKGNGVGVESQVEGLQISSRRGIGVQVRGWRVRLRAATKVSVEVTLCFLDLLAFR